MLRISVRVLLLGVAAALAVADGLQAAPQGYQFYPTTPCRVVDTRRPNGSTGGPNLTSLSTRSFPMVGGTCGVPSTAKAIALNVTIANPTNPGYLIVFPYNIAQPLVSTINWDAGEYALANGAIVPLTNDPNYNLSVYAELYGGGTVNVILDVTGYFQ